jgi:hypothetical protein
MVNVSHSNRGDYERYSVAQGSTTAMICDPSGFRVPAPVRSNYLPILFSSTVGALRVYEPLVGNMDLLGIP